nr:hypothetical protein [Tanacetum cinerariifolium]
MESDEFIKSSVENLVPNPSESEDLSDSECDVPACDEFTTFSNLLFDADDDFSSSDDESFFDEDISKEIYSNPMFDEEIISMDPHHFNIDYLLDEFAGELILLKSIPPRIDETNCDPEEEIHIREIVSSLPQLHLRIIDDQSLFDEDVSEKIYSNPLFDEEIIPMEINSHSFNAEFDLIGSMPNHDSSVIISSKIDFLFDEFAGELTHLKSFLPGIDKTDCQPEKEIRLTKRLLYDNSSPRPPKEIVSDNSNAVILFSMSSLMNSFISNQFHRELMKLIVILRRKLILPRDFCMITHLLVHRKKLFLTILMLIFESFSPSPIPIKDSDPLMEEIDLSFTPDDLMPSGIKEDNYDSERDIPILEELLDNYSLSLPKNKLCHFDIPSPYRPPAKLPDGNTGTLNIKMMGDFSEQKVPIPGLMITQVSNQEKSPDLVSHQGLEAFQTSA